MFNLTHACCYGCLSKTLFVYDHMSKYPQTTLSLCFVLSLVYCFSFVVTDLEFDISTFSYVSLSKLKKFRIYYRGDMVVESSIKSCCTICNWQSLMFYLTMFSMLFFLSCFIKPIYLKMWREATSYLEFVCDF